MRVPSPLCSALPLLLLAGCPGPAPDKPEDTADTGEPPVAWECVIPAGTVPDYSEQVGCWDDFTILASEPLDASIPGARSGKTVVDRMDGNHLYFQNSSLYPIHWDFASANLSGEGLPYVADMGTFNATEYTSPDRRFILGAVTWYDEPGVWVYEIAPYDSATSDLIATAFDLIRDNAYFGGELYFHPTSEAVEAEAADLPDDIPLLTTDELYEGITYQPLNLGTSMGQLSFHTVDELDDINLDFREIVVLDEVPNDIDVVSGLITATFQTPLSHVNVLSQNRGTPNMALKGAMEEPTLLALDGKWIELTVEAMSWSVREVTQEEADTWWEGHKPTPVDVTPMDLTVTSVTPIHEVVDLDHLSLDDAIAAGVPAFGGKATHYGALTWIGEEVPIQDAFVIPVYFYRQFMEENGLWSQAEAMIADPEFQGDLATREARLEELQEAILAAPVDDALIQDVSDRIMDQFDGARFKFRSSTNAEDINGFNGAGLYTSESGDPDDPERPIDDAIRTVWASLWNYRAFQEREYYSITQMDIGMAVLCTPSFTDEEANGVAITANIYDTTGLEPGFYVNVQEGEESVVLPDPGVTSDQFIYYYQMPGQPITYIAHSSLVDEGETVLTSSEVYTLGTSLAAIHAFFLEVYGTTGGFYGMDVEFKFDDQGSGDAPTLFVKQARPYPGWGAD